MTQFGMVARKVTNGATKEAAIHIKAVTKMVATEAFPEMATHPTDSPYVVFGHPWSRRHHQAGFCEDRDPLTDLFQ